MGRQAYLAKIAFGRSAFVPTQEAAQSDHYIQLESSQAEIPVRYQSFNGNNYLQLYDERGNPMNPRSQEYGKRLRNAQNDVLAAVGVVQRRHSPGDGLPGLYAARVEELDDEDTAGNVLALVMPLTQQLCLWWVAVVRDRILTFRYHAALPFAQIVISEYISSGNAIMYTGTLARLLSAICTQTVVYSAFVYRPIERLLMATSTSSKARKLLRRARGALRFSLRVIVELLFYPLAYHADLQRVGLLPARPLLPSWRFFIPFSGASPLSPLSMYYDPSASTIDCFKAALTSPLVLFCAEQFFERWIYAAVNEAVDSSMLRPDNPDIVGRNFDDEHRTSIILGLRRESPRSVRYVVNRLLTALGWGAPHKDDRSERHRTSDTQPQVHATEPPSIDVSGITIENVTPLELPISSAPADRRHETIDVNDLLMSLDIGVDLARPTTPPTPTVFEFQEGDDPRIRITSRDDVVEMEVRLPPRILSSHTEITDTPAVPQGLQGVRPRHAIFASNRAQHRVSQLSIESSRMIGAMVKTQLVGLAVLPLRIVVLRLIASHYLASHGSLSNSRRIVSPLSGFKDVTWGSLGVQMSRIGLCSALQIAIDLSLWSFQYITAVRLGKGLFGWGTL